MTSSGDTMPMSPCSASTGCRNTALVPVDTRVWQIFCAMKPLLPTPVNRTLPLQARHVCRQQGALALVRLPAHLPGAQRSAQRIATAGGTLPAQRGHWLTLQNASICSYSSWSKKWSRNLQVCKAAPVVSPPAAASDHTRGTPPQLPPR